MNDLVEENRSYILDGKELKPNLVKNDINEEMKSRAYDLAFRSLEKYSVEKDMADYIQSKFDEEFLPSWQCVVGKDFAVSLSHESENFLFFSIENTYFLLFKI
jgi:dynein light chain LC8-type